MTLFKREECREPALKMARIAAIAAMALLFTRTAGAIIVPGAETHDWDTNPSDGVGNWTVLGSSASIGENTGNPADHWLQIDFPSTPGAPGDSWYETVYVPAEDLFAGAWDDTMFLEFDFFAEDTAPAALQVRLGVDGGNVWGYDIDTANLETNDWRTYQASLSDWEDWRINPFLTEDDYLTDLESLDWIGIYIYKDGVGPETYGLDDFNLMVPEPTEMAFLGGALAMVIASIRRRKKTATPAQGPSEGR